MASTPTSLPLAAGQAGIDLFVGNMASLGQVSGGGTSIWSSSHISGNVPQLSLTTTAGRNAWLVDSNGTTNDGTRGHFAWLLNSGTVFPNRFRMLVRYSGYATTAGNWDPCVIFASNNASGASHYALVHNFVHNSRGVVCNKIEAGALVGSVAVTGLGGLPTQPTPGPRLVIDIDFATPVVTSPVGYTLYTSSSTNGDVTGGGGCNNALFGVFAAGWNAQVLTSIGLGAVVTAGAGAVSATMVWEEFIIQRHPLDW